MAWLATSLAFALGVLAQLQGIPGSLRAWLTRSPETNRRSIVAPIWREPLALLMGASLLCMSMFGRWR